MNEQEKILAMNSEIDRLLQHPAPLPVQTENMTTEDEALLKLAQQMARLDFSAQSSFLRRWQQTKGANMQTIQPKVLPARRHVLAAVGTAVALLLLALLVLPPVRARAQELWQSLFTRHDSDTASLAQPYHVSLEPTATPLPVAERQLPLTIAEAEALAGYEVWEPAYLPAGYQLASVHYDEVRAAVTQLYLNGGLGISIRQEPAARVEPWSIGQSAVIETVSVGAVAGEYVRGAWVEVKETAAEEDTAVVAQQRWDPDDPYQRLRWTEEEMAYTIGTTVGQEMGLQVADLVAIAESLK